MKEPAMLLSLTPLLISIVSSAQSVPVAEPIHVKLLPGYQQQWARSLDSTTGSIWKKDALRITCDVGKMAGVYTDCASCGWNNGEEWRKKQQFNGQEAVVVFTKARRLVVSFPQSNANFYATVRDESDLADMLLMISTFELRALLGELDHSHP